MKEIDNGLLSEILGEEVNETIILEGSILKYSYKYLGYAEINIYELTHLCKEWALSKGYYLRAEQGINYYDKLQWVGFLNTDMNDGADYVEYWNMTEPEALIKACEWLRNKIREEN